MVVNHIFLNSDSEMRLSIKDRGPERKSYKTRYFLERLKIQQIAYLYYLNRIWKTKSKVETMEINIYAEAHTINIAQLMLCSRSKGVVTISIP